MSISLNYAALSDVGLVRRNNQDAGYASQNLLVLADGMGGAAAGDIASAVTVAHVASIDDTRPLEELLPALREALVDAQQELAQRVQENPAMAGLGTTCIAIMRSNNKLAMTHIGDSRAYLLRGGTLSQVTHDHTLVQYLVDHGELTQEEAEHHPKRNVIMRAISDTPESVDVDQSIREAIPGDRWLLCSDGLFGVVSKETIKATLIAYPDLHECANVLISLALAAGAPDNVTAVLADVIDDSDLSPDMRIPNEPIVVGSAALDYAQPSRGSTSAAGQAAQLLPSKKRGRNRSQERSNKRIHKRSNRRKKSETGATQRAGSAHNNPQKAGLQSAHKANLHGAGRRAAKQRAASRGTSAAGRGTSDLPRAHKNKIWRKILAAFALIAIVALACFGGYTWTQTQYFVGTHRGYVAIYQGIPQEIGSLRLFHLHQTTALKVEDLNSTAQKRLSVPITQSSLREARKVVENLENQQMPQPTSKTSKPSTEPESGASTSAPRAGNSQHSPESATPTLTAAPSAAATPLAAATSAPTHSEGEQ